jgi:hypothetical protein
MKIDLPEVMGLVLADMEPFAKIIGGSPEPALINRHKPAIIALSEFD